MTTQAEWNRITKAQKEAEAKAKNARAVENAAKDKERKQQAIYEKIAQIKKLRIDPAVLEIKNLETQNIPLIRAYNDILETDPTNTGALSIAAQPVNYNFNLIKQYTKRINDAVAEIDKLKLQLKQKIYTGNPNISSRPYIGNPNLRTGAGNAPKVEKIQFSKDYKYNAPMVSSAYFGSNSFEDSVLEGKYVDQGKWGDAREAWKGVNGGRGTIQMDQRFLSTFTTSAESKLGNIDRQKYGFKFLYNPQTISMAWGLMSAMDPYYEASQLDKFQVVATQLMSSTVSFQLMLNRIKDFDYVAGNPFAVPANAYPDDVPIEDVEEIYRKGTMYDLEYLFKTLNGPDATFVSQLNGSTADRGWMRPTIVELHLGDALRYRVRIAEFAVNHVIFTPKMVPILSTVNLTCARFVDAPITLDEQVPTVKRNYLGGGRPKQIL